MLGVDNGEVLGVIDENGIMLGVDDGEVVSAVDKIGHTPQC